jgi:hypothetical protein
MAAPQGVQQASLVDQTEHSMRNRGLSAQKKKKQKWVSIF